MEQLHSLQNTTIKHLMSFAENLKTVMVRLFNLLLFIIS